MAVLAPQPLSLGPAANAVPMQAPMGPQGGTGLTGPQQQQQQLAMTGPNAIPAGMMTGPQEWEWLTMSL